jgi:predicted thioesterase
MKESCRAGIARTRRITIDRDRTIDFMGEEGRVYATPFLVRDIEATCRDLLLEHANAGEDSVGAHVNLTHTAPTLIGMWVDLSIKIAAVDGRRVRFEVTGRDAIDEICKGEHTRFVVDTAKTIERLKAKAAKAHAAS